MGKAIVIVDMLNDFIKKDEQYRGKLVLPGAKTIVGNISKIKGIAEEYGVAVVYAKDDHPKGDPEFNAYPEHALRDTYGAEVFCELAPVNGNIIIPKQDLSMFTNKEADGLLRAKGIDELVVTGIATEHCVRTAVLDAVELGYKVSVVVDAIAGVDRQPGDQYRALIEMGNAGARPVYTREVLEEVVRIK